MSLACWWQVAFSITLAVICLSAFVTFSEGHRVLLVSPVAEGKHSAIKPVNVSENYTLGVYGFLWKPFL